MPTKRMERIRSRRKGVYMVGMDIPQHRQDFWVGGRLVSNKRFLSVLMVFSFFPLSREISVLFLCCLYV